MRKRVRNILILPFLAGFAPIAGAQQPKPAEENRLAGAALCIAAGEYLISRNAATNAIKHDAKAWRDVFNLVEAADADREAELSQMKAAFVEFEGKSKDLGVKAALGLMA
ncbi:MAG TPA: hypothetical protein VFV70_00325, partial [Hyphomonadaceae bacterium]|nr:hypothetical protein [Hyphomonadaceae bacterium]